MNDFFTFKNLKAFIITLSILIVFCILSNLDSYNILPSIVNAVTNSMQGVAAQAVESIVKKSYEDLEKENEELRKEVQNLKAQLVDYETVKSENNRLWKYYQLKRDNPDYDMVPANVIRRDPNDAFYSFTVDQGASVGISVNDVVVTQGGLIGRVSQVDTTTSKITTILSPETKVGVLDSRTRDSGIINGNINYAGKNLTTLINISASSEIEKGDIIITTGISGMYPEKLEIGKVKDFAYDEFDTSRYAVIEPSIDIRTVTDVVIVTNFLGYGDVLTKEQFQQKEEAEQASAATTAPPQETTEPASE